MGLTNSLYTGLSGLTTHSEMLTVAGNNIANVNTPGFKGSRLTFESHILQNLGSASGPNAVNGGVNPAQIGMGTRLGTISKNFNPGTLQPTGVNTDLAIEGNGFFILSYNGQPAYTRAGNFALDRDLNLTKDGALVQGFGINAAGEVQEGSLDDIRIPLGDTLAKATENVSFAGNLNAAGDTATVGSITTSDPLYSDALATTPATAADALTTLYDASGTALFASGDVITISGAAKGGATLADHTFEIGAANTTGSDDFGTLLSDFLTFMDEVLGLDTAADAGAGITVSAAGEIVVTSNTGEVNGIALAAGNIIVNEDTTATLPFTFTDTQDADGESVRTTFVAFDTLGNPLNIHLSMVLEEKANTGTTWRFYAQSADDTDVDRVLGTGTVAFDNEGKVATETDTTFTIDRANTGADSPQQITLNFQGTGGTLTALADVSSQFNAQSQDGASTGALQDFSVSEDGTIVGVYSNGLLRTLGRVAVAKFTNPQGLKEIGSNLYNVTANSGEAQIVTAGTGGTGRVVGGSLELSNVELSQEFINLITASTGFSASSRVMTTSDRLVQELLQSVR